MLWLWEWRALGVVLMGLLMVWARWYRARNAQSFRSLVRSVRRSEARRSLIIKRDRTDRESLLAKYVRYWRMGARMGSQGGLSVGVEAVAASTMFLILATFMSGTAAAVCVATFLVGLIVVSRRYFLQDSVKRGE